MEIVGIKFSYDFAVILFHMILIAFIYWTKGPINLRTVFVFVTDTPVPSHIIFICWNSMKPRIQTQFPFYMQLSAVVDISFSEILAPKSCTSFGLSQNINLKLR